MEIQTARLIISPLRDSDFEAFFRLVSDREVMKYIREPETETEFRARIQRVKTYAKDLPGFGSFRIGDRMTGKFWGNAIIRHADFQVGRDIEIGYLLIPEIWGKGYGTEVASALANFVLTQLQAPKVIAYIDANNKASERVLLKNGFVVTGEEMIYEAKCLRLEKMGES